MIAEKPLRKQKYRSIFISDVHLGFRGCQAEFLLHFLQSTKSDYLYLIGDIFDGWEMRKIRDGVTATRRNAATVMVSVACEYEGGDPNNGYTDGCPAALLSAEISAGRIVDAGVDGDGFEWWIVRSPELAAV